MEGGISIKNGPVVISLNEIYGLISFIAACFVIIASIEVFRTRKNVAIANKIVPKASTPSTQLNSEPITVEVSTIFFPLTIGLKPRQEYKV